MYKIFYAIIVIIFIFDITNMPFMAFLDTTCPINTLAWLLIWIMIPETEMKIKYKKEKEEQ